MPTRSRRTSGRGHAARHPPEVMVVSRARQRRCYRIGPSSRNCRFYEYDRTQRFQYTDFFRGQPLEVPAKPPRLRLSRDGAWGDWLPNIYRVPILSTRLVRLLTEYGISVQTFPIVLEAEGHADKVKDYQLVNIIGRCDQAFEWEHSDYDADDARDRTRPLTVSDVTIYEWVLNVQACDVPLFWLGSHAYVRDDLVRYLKRSKVRGVVFRPQLDTADFLPGGVRFQERKQLEQLRAKLHDTLVDELLARLAKAPAQADVAREAAGEIAQRGGDEDLRTLARTLGLLYPTVTDALARDGERERIFMTELLARGPVHLKEFACEYFGKTKDPAAIPLLVEALQSDYYHLHTSALEALAKFEDPGLNDAVYSFATREGVVLDDDIVEALAHFRDRRIAQVIEGALDHSDWGVRCAAGEALARMGSAESIPALEARVAKEDPEHDRFAEEVLQALRESLEQLRRVTDKSG